jgi:hypothetical protein
MHLSSLLRILDFRKKVGCGRTCYAARSAFTICNSEGSNEMERLWTTRPAEKVFLTRIVTRKKRKYSQLRCKVEVVKTYTLLF